MDLNHQIGFLQNIGAPELLIILFIILLLFGAKKLPELARSLGKSVKEFKKAASEADDEIKTAIDSTAENKPPPANGKNAPPKQKEQAG